MSDRENEHQPPTLVETMSGLPDEGSLLESLSKQRQELTENRETYISVAGYSPFTLYIKYRLMDGTELNILDKKIQREFKKDYDRALYGSIDVLIGACLGIFVDIGDGEKQPLTLHGVNITGFGPDLAEALRFTEKVDPNMPARSIVLNLFGNNEVALQQHNLMLGRWMGNTNLNVDEDLLMLGNF